MVETLAVVGTVRLALAPLVARTVTVVPFTAVTTPRTLAKSKPKPPEGRARGLAMSPPSREAARIAPGVRAGRAGAADRR